MKMTYGAAACELNVAENYYFKSDISCPYDKSIVAYAVKRFMLHHSVCLRECTKQSVQLRFAKAKDKHRQDFSYIVAAHRAELPGNWLKISGYVDRIGVNVKKVELSDNYPALKNKRFPHQICVELI